MINLNTGTPQTTDWQQHTPLSDTSDKSDQSNGLENQNAQTGHPNNDLTTLLTKLILTLLKSLLQESGAMNGVNQSHNAGGSDSNPPPSNAGADNIMQNLGNHLMKESIMPTQNGGGQLSQVTTPMNREVSKMMDNNPNAFGTPQNPSINSSVHNAAPTGQFASDAPAGTRSSTSASGVSSATHTMFPKASSDPTVINEPIVVKAGETFDGAGKTFTASSKLGDGGQSEDQKPLFVLENGASLKNVVLGDNEADGIHVKGDAKLDNVHWTNVGEDALTMKKSGTIEISNSSAKGADDKIFQLNAPGKLILNNVHADDFGKLVRTNGGQQGDWDIQLNNVTATNGKISLVRSDSNSVSVTAHNVKTENVKRIYNLPESASLQIS